jgi:hypothetical protein
MATFARLNDINEVLYVVSVNNEVLLDENGNESEQKGIDFLRDLYKEYSSNWKQTSYNTYGGKYYNQVNRVFVLSEDQSKAFRKNHASEGYTYDEQKNAFIPPKIYESWILNQETFLWEAPVPCPGPLHQYSWNEATISWDFIDSPVESPVEDPVESPVEDPVV